MDHIRKMQEMRVEKKRRAEHALQHASPQKKSKKDVEPLPKKDAAKKAKKAKKDAEPLSKKDVVPVYDNQSSLIQSLFKRIDDLTLQLVPTYQHTLSCLCCLFVCSWLVLIRTHTHTHR